MDKTGSIPILAYHKVDRRFEWGVTRLYPPQFEQQMRFLDRRGYEVITLSEGLSGNHSERSVVITFDDAYKELVENAFRPMDAYAFRGTIFVVTDFVGKENTWDVNLGYRKFIHLDWDDLRMLVHRGYEIGSHSHTHPDLTKIGEEKVKEELLISKKMLEDKLGVCVRYFSYPFGRYSETVKKIVLECGYEGGVCLSHPFKRSGDRYEIERVSVYVFDTMMNFRAKLRMYGRWGEAAEKLKGRTVNFFAGATYPLKRLEILFSER
jgi:peptidoglycan/xylan/chitin deacetylase (PgdA/CDA1 family)